MKNNIINFILVIYLALLVSSCNWQTSEDKLALKDRKQVTIYTKGKCGHCQKAMDVLTSHNIAFHQVDLSNDYKTLANLYDMTGIKTVPQVFVKGVLIGNSAKIVELDSQGELVSIINSVLESEG